jgi:hypothetical protein
MVAPCGGSCRTSHLLLSPRVRQQWALTIKHVSFVNAACPLKEYLLNSGGGNGMSRRSRDSRPGRGEIVSLVHLARLEGYSLYNGDQGRRLRDWGNRSRGNRDSRSVPEEAVSTSNY